MPPYRNKADDDGCIKIFNTQIQMEIYACNFNEGSKDLLRWKCHFDVIVFSNNLGQEFVNF